MQQSRLMSLAESVTNVVIGYPRPATKGRSFARSATPLARPGC